MPMGICRCGCKTEGATVRFEGDVSMTLYICQNCREDTNQLIQRMKPVRAAMAEAKIPDDLATAAIRSIIFGMMRL